LKNSLIAFALFIVTTTACQETKIVKSEIMHEKAQVAMRIYTPSRHDTKLTPTMSGGSNMGVGVDWNGNVGLNLGNGLQVSSVSVPAKYAVAFRCQHGEFVIDGTKWRHLYDEVKEGDRVVIAYQELYRQIWDDKDGDGKDEMISNELFDLDFLGITPESAE
jgi:hypothetical protein